MNKSRLFIVIFAFIFLFFAAGVWYFQENSAVDAELDQSDSNVLRAVFPFVMPNSLDVLSSDQSLRQVMVNVYEPLVFTDKDLNFYPGLAVNWGRLDDLTWEFELRNNVKMHNGSLLTVEDVVYSLNLHDLEDWITSVEAADFLGNPVVRIKTKDPDPLFLQKIANIFIVASDKKDVGTGPYVLDEINQDQVKLTVFEDYWGGEITFDQVEMILSLDKNERVSLLTSGDADFLSFVPFDAVDFLVDDPNIELKSISSLELQFLLFNFDSLSELWLRKAIYLALDKDEFLNNFSKFVHNSDQYVSAGVLGYNSSFDAYDFNLIEAKKLIVDKGGYSSVIHVHLPLNMETLGSFIKTSLENIGLDVVVSYLSNEDLSISYESSGGDIYFLGFRSETGDAQALYDLIFQSSAEYNLGNYFNKNFDSLLNDISFELNKQARIFQLREAMKILIDDFVGVPLFEFDTLFAYQKNRIDFQPRIDGLIYFKDFKLIE
jgi:peptide/nickel transport system substrate-binding protein